MSTLTVAPEPEDRDTQLADIVDAIHRLDAEKTRIDEQRSLYAARLLELLPDGTTPVGGSKVVITRPRRFDAAAFEAAYGPHTNAGLYRPTLDRKKVDAFIELGNIDPAPFFQTGKRQVTVR